jgi:hypothetical protein
MYAVNMPVNATKTAQETAATSPMVFKTLVARDMFTATAYARQRFKDCC